ncbi:Chromosome partitioning ATPase, Mrp family, contains Fe-S cluster [Hathewaya proteolytica DSM 3090]|uniref:Iron-sulfur cluster carrier protein n=1 Tax=Hathewaya proteolytica DSM 3090 TaxID=1121331 RepID=A0A1M6RLZ8_9CLOT|nr:Mrp/NBP35 family ATP-binding protein [Hathewaya proteolytica]SHK33378.1 Chromosome partitioning ATPase, Mrp family, contains Fe-S cluster [Hathewaya proteolytica DSM 3090]
MSSCSECKNKDKCSKSTGTASCNLLKIKYGEVKNVVGVISGKGGVGKSTVTGILASKLRNEGYSVGVLDADITGPSMPRFFGINEKRSEVVPTGEKDSFKFIPVSTEKGIVVNSLNLMTEREEDPVIWRGPVINGVLNQMFSDTEWGELDYLLIDMPPGTGDVALTVMQSMPIDAMIIVSTPQDMVSMIVKKVVNMAKKLNISLLGVVENMSYVTCNCGERIRIFSEKPAIEAAKELGLPLLSEMPIDREITKHMENKDIEKYLCQPDLYDDLLNSFKSEYKKILK